MRATFHSESDFNRVSELLRHCTGEANAVTIKEIVKYAALRNRRTCEKLLEERLDDFDFPLTSSSKGYFIPKSAEEINHYLASLQSRAKAIFQRKQTVIRKAKLAGFPRTGKLFIDPPSPQFELQLELI